MRERYTPEEIHYMDNGILTLDNDRLRRAVAMALAKAPMDVVDCVTDNCLFLMALAEEKGCYLQRELLEGKAIISLSEALMDNPEELERTILHEAAHHYLGHKNPLLADLSLEQYDHQEAEAWELVEHWLEGER